MKIVRLIIGCALAVCCHYASADLAGMLFDLAKKELLRNEQSVRPPVLSQEEASALFSRDQHRHSFAACADLFPGRPLRTDLFSASMKTVPLCADSYAVMYSQTSKTPLVVVERLTRAQILDAKGERRTNQFYPDPRIYRKGRAELEDYRGSGYDRGHLAGAANSPNQRAMAQTFSLANMVPQAPENNRGVWAKIETDVRKYVQRAKGDVFVFTGPIFDPGYETIGENKVWVPTRLFKLVYDEASKRAWAYVIENRDTNVSRPVDYSTFVKTTGLDLLGGISVSGSIGHSG